MRGEEIGLSYKWTLFQVFFWNQFYIQPSDMTMNVSFYDF